MRSRRFSNTQLELLENRRLLSSTLVPVGGGQELIHDAARGLLYIPVGTDVQRVDLATRSLLTPFTGVGTALRGGDITPDGSRLYIADSVYTPGSPNAQYGTTFVRKVDLAAGTVSSVPITGGNPDHRMSRGVDLTIAANGQALLTIDEDTDHVLQFNTENDTYRYREDWGGSAIFRNDARVTRSGDRQVLMLLETGSSGGDIHSYFSATDSFGQEVQLGTFNTWIESVNDDGSRRAIESSRGSGDLYVVDDDWGSIATLPGVYTAAAFAHGAGNVIYVADAQTSDLVAFDLTASIPREMFRIRASATFTNMIDVPRAMSVSPDGRQVWFLDPTRLHIFDLPQPDAAVAASFTVENVAAFSPAGYQQTIKVTAYDAVGNVATGYRGTVRIRSTDVRADLPADYTFTAADNGTQTFTVAHHTVGTHTLSVVDLASAAGGSKANLQTHGGNVRDLPIGAQFLGAKLVWNEATGLLYVGGGQFPVLNRYDPVAQVLLPPITIGQGVSSIDVTPDGGTVLVAEQVRGFNQGMFRKVDVATGAVTNLRYDNPTGALDVAVFANGKALGTLVDRYVRHLMEIDVASGEIKPSTIGYGGNLNHQQLSNAGTLTRSLDASTGVHGGSPGFVYDAASHSIPYAGLTGPRTALNRDGSLIAFANGLRTYVRDRTLQTTYLELPGSTYGVALNPTRNEFYQASNDSDLVNVYDTTSWTRKSSFPIGSPVRLFGTTAVSGDGDLLFMMPDTGPTVVRLYPLRTRPVITALTDTASSPAGMTRTITVNATRPDGTLDTGYRGTVHFTSSDAAVGLPADYTFMAADNGTKTFSVVFNTAGRQTVTVVDATPGDSMDVAPSTAERWVSGASLKPDGTLSIFGTANRDVIAVSRIGANGATVNVTFGTVNASFPAASVLRLAVDTLGGNDSVTVGDGLPGGWADLDAGSDDLRVGSAVGAVAGVRVGWSVAGGDGEDIVTLDPGAAPLRFLADTLASTSNAFNRVVINGTGSDDRLNASAAYIPLHVANPGAFPMPRSTLSVSRLARSMGTAAGTATDVELSMVGSLTFNGGAGNDSLDLSGLPLDGVYTAVFNGDAGNDTMTGLAGPNSDLSVRGIVTATFIGGEGAADAFDWTFTNATKNFTVDSGRTTDSSVSANYDATVENLTIDGGGGNDVFNFVTLSTAHVPLFRGGAGDDRINVPGSLTQNTAFRFDGGTGADTVSFTPSETNTTVATDRISDAGRTVHDRDVEAIEVIGRVNADNFNVIPRIGTTISVIGNAPTTSPGDALTVNIAGANSPQQEVTGTGSGRFTFLNRATITYAGIESVTTISPQPPSWLAQGSAATWDPIAKSLTITGPTTITANPGSDAPLITATGTAAVLTINPSVDTQIHLGGLTLSNGATATLTNAAAARVLIINAGGLSVSESSSLDLTDNALILRDGSLAAVQSLVTTGFHDGDWLGSGLTSSAAAADSDGLTALGYLDNAELGASEFAGVTGLTGNEILIKYTYYGDADLSGHVTLDDFNQFLYGYQNPGVERTWLNGDFDFSGAITLDDFNQFLFGYQEQDELL